MKLKKSKQEVLNEIRNRASSAAQSSINSSNLLRVNIDTNSFVYAIQDAIASAVEEGFEVLLENQYTDDDFERDMNLK